MKHRLVIQKLLSFSQRNGSLGLHACLSDYNGIRRGKFLSVPKNSYEGRSATGRTVAAVFPPPKCQQLRGLEYGRTSAESRPLPRIFDPVVAGTSGWQADFEKAISS